MIYISISSKEHLMKDLEYIRGEFEKSFAIFGVEMTE
jgi:hypothetical protein